MSLQAISAPVADLLPELVALRRDLHAHPELAYEEQRTAGIVAQSLRLLGLQVHEGIGGTGVVGTLRCGSGGPRSVGLRADMDALPMVELGRSAHASRHPGRHHGCGHDGHTSMLIGAARQLARQRDFDGTVHFIFQPAEEGKGGARRMIEDGLFERFACDSVYALHNWPDLPLGQAQAQTRPGPIMAAADRFDIAVRGRGGHAAQPQHTPDAILAASQLVAQLNTIVARAHRPRRIGRAVGHPHRRRTEPQRAAGRGADHRHGAQLRRRIAGPHRSRPACHGCRRGPGQRHRGGGELPALLPRHRQTRAGRGRAGGGAARAIGLAADMAPRPAFTSEDFAFMLREKPGAYLWLGQGRADPGPDGERALHHPCYDFNDDALPLGVRWFCEVAARALARPQQLEGRLAGGSSASAALFFPDALPGRLPPPGPGGSARARLPAARRLSAAA